MHPVFEKRFFVLGIVNVTPDSFFDGGKYATTAQAVEHGLSLVGDGADLLDIGGESTRPGAMLLGVEEEMARVVPVVSALSKRTSIPLCVDTTKAIVAQAAIDAGATWINDISAGRFDPKMPLVISKNQCHVILMHSRHTPQSMQKAPMYDDVIADVSKELLCSVDQFRFAGVAREKIVIDPGIGFAKRAEDNMAILSKCDEFSALGFPVCIGASRKSFIGFFTQREAAGRLAGSLACVAAAFYKGARYFRVHDVKETVDMLKMLEAVKYHG